MKIRRYKVRRKNKGSKSGTYWMRRREEKKRKGEQSKGNGISNDFDRKDLNERPLEENEITIHCKRIS